MVTSFGLFNKDFDSDRDVAELDNGYVEEIFKKNIKVELISS